MIRVFNWRNVNANALRPYISIDQDGCHWLAVVLLLLLNRENSLDAASLPNANASDATPEATVCDSTTQRTHATYRITKSAQMNTKESVVFKEKQKHKRHLAEPCWMHLSELDSSCADKKTRAKKEETQRKSEKSCSKTGGAPTGWLEQAWLCVAADH